MIAVTACEPAEHRKKRIRLDNGITLLLYRSEAGRFHLSEGEEISEEDYEKLLQEVVGKRAKKRALHLLERMDRTEKQLRDKLREGEYPPSCIEAAIDYVKQYHYLDDFRYACNFVRYSQEKMSRRQILLKLGQKGISKEDADRALLEEYEGDESEQIAALLEKRHYIAGEADPNEFWRTYQFLLRRGFQSNDILRAMKK